MATEFPQPFQNFCVKIMTLTTRDFDSLVDDLLLIASVDFLKGEIESGNYAVARRSLRVLMKTGPGRKRVIDMLSKKTNQGPCGFTEIMSLIRAMLTGRNVSNIIIRKQLQMILHNS